MRGGKAMPLKPIVDEALAHGRLRRGAQTVIVYRRTGTAVPMKRRRDIWWHDVVAGPGRRPASRNWVERRASAVHPLHLRLHRQAQGRAALHRRLPAVGHPDDEVGVRLKPIGRFLVHRRRRLGDRPHLHHLRAAGGRRDRNRVRGRADLSRRRALLEDDPGPQGQRLLHRADGDPLADQGCGSRELPKKYDLSSLRLLGTVGEPINPEAWMWYYTNVGGGAARSSTPGGRPKPAAT